MTDIKPIPLETIHEFPKVDEAVVESILREELFSLNRKVVVLDDDPTGIQTVHGITVFTDWETESIEKGFDEEQSMFFILTNSRSFSEEKTIGVHKDIGRKVAEVSLDKSKDFLLISRGDSTLRGHYPLETEILKESIESSSSKRFDGEVIIPFFREGGRFTINNIHYVQEGDALVPCGQTEFARDKTFGYSSSNLARWSEEKTNGKYGAEDVVCISLDDLRKLRLEFIERQLVQLSGFNKVVVNAVDYVDVKIFAIALLRAIKKGKEFLFRSAAALTKVLGGIADKPLLTGKELVPEKNGHGGVVLIGSHVRKTTEQFETLQDSKLNIEFIEFNQHLVITKEGLAPEVARVSRAADNCIVQGKSVVIFTRRDRFDLPDGNKEQQLEIAVKISDAVTSIIANLTVRPRFIIAKGGITSSDVGVKALEVKAAKVMGQILPGIPVWLTGPESKFPNMPYVIFPGNVGAKQSLLQAVETLMSE